MRELEDYEKCPHCYLYQTYLKKEKTSGAIYLEFSRAIYKTLNFYTDEITAKRQIALEELQKVFQEKWTQSAHAYHEIYADEAFGILQNAHAKISANLSDKTDRKIQHLDLPNGRVLFSPTFYRESENEKGEKIRLTEYWRNGKLRKTESSEILYQLLYESAKINFVTTEIKVTSLKTGEEIFVPRKLRRGKEIPSEEKFSKLIKAIDGIINQDFSPKPNDNCPSCQFYFICTKKVVL